MEIHVNGKSYGSIQEWADEQKHNPDSTSIIWEYQSAATIINGIPKDADGTNGTGKCWYKGRSYEGKIEYRADGLYVGGELVKPNNPEQKQYQQSKQEATMEEKNYETLTLHGQGANVRAAIIKKLEVHGQGHDIYVKDCGEIEMHGQNNQVHKEGAFDTLEDAIGANWDNTVETLKSHNVYILDEDESLECNIPDNLLEKEYIERFGGLSIMSDKELKEALERRGWTVKCTRTKTEEL